jgi:hypothetical protein
MSEDDETTTVWRDAVATACSERRRQSAKDIPRLRALPFLEQLADRGDAMKIVPMFAIEMIQEAAEYIDGLLVENADFRAAIKHLGHNPVTFINRARRRREREGN